MKYIIADMTRARSAGFDPLLHLAAGGRMVINARELEINPRLTGTLAQRAEALGGTVYQNAAAAKMAVNELNKKR